MAEQQEQPVVPPPLPAADDAAEGGGGGVVAAAAAATNNGVSDDDDAEKERRRRPEEGSSPSSAAEGGGGGGTKDDCAKTQSKGDGGGTVEKETTRGGDGDAPEAEEEKKSSGSSASEANDDRKPRQQKAAVAVVKVGGKIEKPAYALLEGIVDVAPLTEKEKAAAAAASTADSGGGATMGKKLKRVQLPIRHLPSTLGRTHKTAEPRFVPMGAIKALSREHCRIEYRTEGGAVRSKNKGGSKFDFEVDDDGDGVVMAPFDDDGDNKSPDSDDGGGGGGGGEESSGKTKAKNVIGAKGSYVITNLSKNRISVNRHVVERGESAVLTDGSALRIATLSLYFLLPEDRGASAANNNKTMQVPTRKRWKPGSKTSSPVKKSGGAKRSASSTTSIPPPNKKPKLAGTGGGSSVTSEKSASTRPTLQAEIDALSTDELLRQLSDAVDSDAWDRRHQLIGGTISYRAVVECAEDPEIQKVAIEGGGIARTDIMQWIAQSPRFKNWYVCLRWTPRVPVAFLHFSPALVLRLNLELTLTLSSVFELSIKGGANARQDGRQELPIQHYESLDSSEVFSNCE